MAEWRTIGLTSIKVGAIAGDGGMGTSLAILGKTAKGTAKLTTADPTVTDFFSEEDILPVEHSADAGATTFNFAIMDFAPATLVKIFGGTATGTGDTATWEAPSQYAEIELSLEITTKKGIIYAYPRVKIVAKFNVDFGSTAIGMIDIIATPLTPTKAGTAFCKISKAA